MEHPENSEEYKGLVVNKGIEQPSSVNPYLKRKPKKRQLSVAEFVEGIVKGDVTILSQAVLSDNNRTGTNYKDFFNTGILRHLLQPASY